MSNATQCKYHHLNVLRNPWGWPESAIRAARLWAADEIERGRYEWASEEVERLRSRNEELEAALRETRACLYIAQPNVPQHTTTLRMIRAIKSADALLDDASPPDSESVEGAGGGWISVHDALPHKGSLVLVTYKGGKRGRSVHVARWTGEKWLLTDRMKKVQDRVTAWMPCPNPFVGPGKSFRTSDEPAEGAGGEDVPQCHRCGEAKTEFTAVVCPKCDVTFHLSRPASGDTAQRQDAMLERREVMALYDWLYDHVRFDDEDKEEGADKMARLYCALAEPAVPEVVRRLPSQWRESWALTADNGWNRARHACADELDRALVQSEQGRVPEAVNVVFDGPPGPNPPHFVEVETDDGRSVRVGEWIERDDGMWALRIDRAIAQSEQGEQGNA